MYFFLGKRAQIIDVFDIFPIQGHYADMLTKFDRNLREEMEPTQLKLNELACAKGASSWLTLLPLADEGYDLHKELFWDLIRIRV